MMHRSFRAVLVACALAASACSRHDQQAALVDSSLSRDLTTAAQTNQLPPSDTVSSLERTAAVAAPVAVAPARSAAEPAPRRPRRVHRSTSAGEVASGSTSSASSAGAVAAQQEPRTVIEKHPQRDAAIGAAAGAILGAATSRNKVKGGIIGGAAGAILGGVLGNNVDKKKTVP